MFGRFSEFNYASRPCYGRVLLLGEFFFRDIWRSIGEVWFAVRSNPSNGFLFGQASNPGPIKRSVLKEDIPGQVAATLAGQFYPSAVFERSWEGFVYKFDRFGTGYYRDNGYEQCNEIFSFPDCPEPRQYKPWENWGMYEEESEATREFNRRLTSKALRGKHTVEYLSVNGNTSSTVETSLRQTLYQSPSWS